MKVFVFVIMSWLCTTVFAAEPSVYISRAEVMLLPTSGAIWNSVVSDANRSVAGLNLADQDDNRSSYLFAKALIGVRTNNTTMLAEVRGACMAAIGTQGDRTLALGRELRGVVISADLAQLSVADNVTFCNWLRGVIRQNIGGRTLISTHEDRPNNWGTHAGASRIAADIYLINHGTTAQATEAQADLNRAALVFKGYLGDTTAYNDFNFGELDWQSDPNNPVGINPVGATIQGHNVDGVAPDDQRRGGGFRWPPPEENYVREALQGATDQAEMLTRQGFPAFGWESSALFRACVWLHDEAHTDFSDNGDESTIDIINFRYSGRNFPTFHPAGPTRSLGYADWTHGPGRPQGNVSDPPTDPPPTPSGLIVSPTTIAVATRQFLNASTQLINVTSDGSPLSFTVTSSESWAIPTPASSTTPQGVNVAFQTSALPIGTYTSTLTFTPSTGTARTVTITLNITASDPPPDPDPTPGPEQTIAVRVSAGSDDAEERLRKAVSLNDGDTTLVDPAENIEVGIRFTNVAIPRGATIVSAKIEFIANKAGSDFCRLHINAHSASNSPTFVSSTGNITNRVGTSNSVFWEPGSWIAGTVYETPNLNLTVKEVTSRSDWNAGGPITFLFANASGTGKRIAKNFNSSASAARLVVTYK